MGGIDDRDKVSIIGIYLMLMLFFAVIAFKRLNEVFAQFALHMCGCHFKKNDERSPLWGIFIQEGAKLST